MCFTFRLTFTFWILAENLADLASPLLFVSFSSLQPAGVQPERLPHLFGSDKISESDSLLCLQRRVRDGLERSGCGGTRALPDLPTVTFWIYSIFVFSKLAIKPWSSVHSWDAHKSSSARSFSLRSSALGFFTAVARVAAIMGNVVFGKLVDTNCAVPVLLVSSLLLTGGLVALLLPQTRQTQLTWPLPHIIEECSVGSRRDDLCLGSLNHVPSLSKSFFSILFEMP